MTSFAQYLYGPTEIAPHISNILSEEASAMTAEHQYEGKRQMSHNLMCTIQRCHRQVCGACLLQTICAMMLPAMMLWYSTGRGGHLATAVGPGRVLRGKQHEVRVWFDHLSQLGNVQLPVVVQQPAYSTNAVSL